MRVYPEFLIAGVVLFTLLLFGCIGAIWHGIDLLFYLFG